MTTKQLDDAAWKQHPYTHRNNRGVFRVLNRDGSQRVIRCGIPEPRGRETADDYKGGDRIGWTTVEVTPNMVGEKIAVFTSIEIKGPGDTPKPGQIKWHNLVLQHGGISEIWRADGSITKEPVFKEPV